MSPKLRARPARTFSAGLLLLTACAASFGGCDGSTSTDDEDGGFQIPGTDGGAPLDSGFVFPDAGSFFDGAFPAFDGGVGDSSVFGDATVGSDATVSGDATVGGDAAVVPSGPTNICKLHGYEVVLVGDSYINLTGFAGVLADITHKAGVLPATESYVDHSLSGASMDGVPSIPSQWPDALADAKVRGAKKVPFAILTGGGNDVLVNNRSCLNFAKASDITPACKNVVTKAIQRGQEMVDQAAKDGLEQAIYFFYPHLPRGGIGGGPYPNTILDYALPQVKAFCESQTKVKCTFVDLVPAFDDGTGFAKAGLINVDGIHPTATGTKLMADVIWKVMQEKCLAAQAP